MALVHWAPFDLASAGFDDLVRRTFNDAGSGWRPALDAYVEGGHLTVRLEAPGMALNDLDIEIDGNVLKIRGERQPSTVSEDARWFRRESTTYGAFERRVSLPQGVDTEAVRAAYDAGILTVTIPMPQKQSTKVKVELGGTQQPQLTQ